MAHAMADALVEDALRTLLAPALRGERAQRELQLFGPPREVSSCARRPLWRRNRVIGAGRVRARRLRAAKGRERPARLRRQREP